MRFAEFQDRINGELAENWARHHPDRPKQIDVIGKVPWTAGMTVMAGWVRPIALINPYIAVASTREANVVAREYEVFLGSAEDSDPAFVSAGARHRLTMNCSVAERLQEEQAHAALPDVVRLGEVLGMELPGLTYRIGHLGSLMVGSIPVVGAEMMPVIEHFGEVI